LVCQQLCKIQAQVFITSIDRQDIMSAWPGDSDLGLFHVEQGVVALEDNRRGDLSTN